MNLKRNLILAVFCAVFAQSANATIAFNVQNYTANSITFSLTGQMPTTQPAGMNEPNQLDINYTGDLYSGPSTYYANSMSGDPLTGDGGFSAGNTGGFGLANNYSWMNFTNNLTGLSGNGTSVTLSWGADTLNTTGTGSFDLYWGNISGETSGDVYVLLGSVSVVNGQITGFNSVPEPASLALLGIGLIGLGVNRKRKHKKQAA